jgi:uncharacterized protein
VAEGRIAATNPKETMPMPSQNPHSTGSKGAGARKWMRVILGVPVLTGLLLVAGVYIAGSIETAPAQISVGVPPPELQAETVSFDSGSGSRLSGWLVPGQPHRGGIVLMHGIRANRLQMLERARMFHAKGFAVLLFDFQAHGESPGEHITLGYLESRDARAAFDFLRQRLPGERLGVLGVSMGGAAAVLSEKPLEADAMVLEAVYGSFDDALMNRLVMRFSIFSNVLFPLYKVQVEPRLGFDPDWLAPARAIAKVRAPLLLIAGDVDRHASLAEMKAIYANAHEPKELWIIPGANHTDFHRFAPEEYERRVLGLFTMRLAQDSR